MPTTKLPRSVADYVAGANAQDINAVTACFSEDAVVRDEGKSRQGISAIREWAEEVSRKYRPTVEILDVAETDGRTIVTGRVSGNFPGSPIDLRYAFTILGEKIVGWRSHDVSGVAVFVRSGRVRPGSSKRRPRIA